MWFTPGCRLMGSLSLIPLLLTRSTFFSSSCQFLLVLFFHFFRFFSISPSICHLFWKRKKCPPILLFKQDSLFLSLCMSHLHFFLRHPHTMLSVGKHRPIQPVGFSLLGSVRWSITWFDGSYYRPAFPGQKAGIFIAADTGSYNTPHPLKEDYNLTQVWFIMICLSFEGNVK